MRRDLDQLEHNQFDMLVIGGGIYGICIARDAILRGLKVALIESDDFGSGTSHNSLKIIHGGIRYLQHLNFKRVRESVREREMWVKISNTLIRPLQFILPTYGYGTRGHIALAAAIKMHNSVAAMQNNFRAYPDGHMLSKSKCVQLIPELKNNKISGAAVWYDGQIIDADRLHIELLKDAFSKGLCLANYVKAEQIHIVNKKASGVTVTDKQSERSFDIKANVIVNATGPWAYRLLAPHFQNRKYQTQPLSKNFNIVVDHMGKDFAFGVKSKRASDAVVGSSKRMYFLTPWLNKTVIGTAHYQHNHSDDLNLDIKNSLPGFIDEINEACPSLKLAFKDIRYSYVGFTPAEQDAGKRSTSRSHETSIIDHASEDGIDNLYSVIGVKYTTARSTAQEVVDLAVTKSNLSIKLGSDLIDYEIDKDWQNFSSINDLSLKASISNQEINNTYMKNSERHIQYAIEEEMAMCLEDYFLRRTNLAVRGYLTKDIIEKIAKPGLNLFPIKANQAGEQIEELSRKLNFSKD